jgi:hypothetical protein
MLTDAIDSVKENIKQKIGNPFLGTFVLVWVVKNWQVVYAFFFFDSDFKLADRIKYFKDYWKDKNFIGNLIWIVIITIGVLLITYLFLALSRLIANYYENVIIPLIQRWSKGSIVTSEIHQIALDRIFRLEKKIDEERKNKIELENEVERLEKRGYNKDDVENGVGKFNDVISNLSSSFEKAQISSVFTNIAQNSQVESKSPIVAFLLNNGIIEFKDYGGQTGYRYYKFTSLGNEFRREYFAKHAS